MTSPSPQTAKPASNATLLPPESNAVALIREAVSYDPETGLFTWSNSRGGRVITGRRAGRSHNDGYWRINVFGHEYLAHRIAWLISFGSWPENQIDHINGIRDDNRLINLREATSGQNAKNVCVRRNNTSGFKGVSIKRDRWLAQIQVNGKKKHLGYFSSKEAAVTAYASAAEKLFGQFVRKSA